ncbi:M56 family metallopeptidase [Candidatus Uhrbacteria bacterium]|nr:M56 family metallopeptidase [Candidatus Uhrbacteria bacterium]
MPVRRVKKQIIFAVAAIVAVVGVVEWLVVRAGLNVLQELRNQSGCSCAGSFIGWQDWIVFGLAALFAVGWLAAVGYFGFTLWRTRKLVRAKSRECGAFTFGFFRPKMMICAHCESTLSSEELTAIRAHEQHHVLRRDPLKFLIVDTLRVMFFFVPLLHMLAAIYRTAAEVEADEEVQNRSALGNALLHFTELKPSGSAVFFAAALTERIERLVNPRWRLRIQIDARALLSTAIFTLGIMGVLFFRPVAPAPTYGCAIAPVGCAGSDWSTLEVSPATYYNGSL